jgi:hypothetical protein
LPLKGDELRAQLRYLVTEGGDQLLLGPLAYVGSANGVHRPVISLPVRNERSDADDRVVDVLRKLIADCLADLHVGLTDKIVRGREPAEIRHGLQVPDDDASLHLFARRELAITDRAASLFCGPGEVGPSCPCPSQLARTTSRLWIALLQILPLMTGMDRTDR